MNLTFDNYHPHEFVKSLATQLKTNSYTDCLEEIIDLSKKNGDGKITGFNFSNGIGFLVFDCVLQNDWILKFPGSNSSPLLFKFDIEGEIWHTFNDGDIHYHLNPLQGSITACPFNSSQNIKLPGQQKILFSILLINRKKYYEKIECILEKIPPKLADIFTDKKAKKAFFYQGNYSISAAECINKIISNKHNGLVRSTFLEGKVLELLSKQIRQYNDDLLNPGKQILLRKYDLEKIKSARDILIDNIANPPIIESLAKKVGINQQKLKKGFKLVFDNTINKYIRDERLERASLLLLQGNTIGEAATEVGYTNKSHFSRVFKNKFGVLPREYLKTIQSRIDTQS